MATLVVWGLASSSCLMIWVTMEVNLLLFTLFIIFSSAGPRGSLALKYFFIQALSGLLFLISVVLVSQDAPWSLAKCVSSGLVLLKLGGWPFYHWVLSVGSKISWEGLFILLTIQKFLPLYFLNLFMAFSWLWLALISWPSLALAAAVMKSAKKIFIISSVYVLMAIAVVGAQGLASWGSLLMLYSLSLMPLFLCQGGDTISQGGAGVSSGAEDGLGFIFIICVVSGIPPFPMFFMKFDTGSILVGLGLPGMALVFFLGSLVMIYLYISVFMAVLNRGPIKKAMANKSGGFAAAMAGAVLAPAVLL